jgi:HEPN domain-containing protein
MKPETLEWVEKAEGDWKVAQREIGSTDPVHNVVCFLAQQCSEKYLKAFLEEQWGAFQFCGTMPVNGYIYWFFHPDYETCSVI